MGGHETNGNAGGEFHGDMLDGVRGNVLRQSELPGCSYQKASSSRSRKARTRYLAILRISASGSGSS